MLLYFARQDLKGCVNTVVRREVPAKGNVLFHLRDSELEDFRQVGNHVVRISLRCCERKPKGRQTG